MTHNNGGPAFPASSAFFKGMTLRDYFAVKAPLSQECIGSIAYQIVGRKAPEWTEFMETNKDARIAYQWEKLKYEMELDAALRFMWADAMLAAREKGGAA